jgi:hypothetical protein
MSGPTPGAVEGTTSYRGGGDQPSRTTPCSVEPDLWFGDEVDQRAAASICWTQCALREECLRIAIDEDHRAGTWGGYTEKERHTMRRARARKAGQPVTRGPRPAKTEPTIRDTCGTEIGYRTHTANGETQCQACRDDRTERRRSSPRGCGTADGYRTHKKRKEDACDPCRAAKAAESAEYRSRDRAPVTLDVAEIEHLAAAGVGIHDIARSLGKTATALERALYRRDQHALVAKLKRAA